MSTRHAGNMLNQVTFEEHDGILNAKKTSLISAATIYAVVNTSAQGQASVVLDTGINWVGFATVAIGSGGAGDGAILDGTDATIKASVTSIADGRYLHVGIKSNSTVLIGNRLDLNSNVTLNASANYIGLASVNLGGPLPALSAGANYIGLATIDIGTQNKVAVAGNVTLSDPKTYIGLVTATAIQGGNWDVGIIRGNVTVEQGDDPWNVAVKGNVTLSDPKTYIGLVTATALQGGNWDVGIVRGNVTLSDAKTYIGLTTTTLGLGDRYIGLVTATSVGLQTLAPSPSFIGLATVRPDFGSNVTVHTQVFSATGNTTIFVAPASNRFFLTNLHVASLGRAEIEIRSGATTLIPFTGLATTGGFIHNFGQPGLPSRAQADALVANLNGAATVSIMASWYAQP